MPTAKPHTRFIAQVPLNAAAAALDVLAPAQMDIGVGEIAEVVDTSCAYAASGGGIHGRVDFSQMLINNHGFQLKLTVLMELFGVI